MKNNAVTGGAVNNGYGMLTATKRYKEQSLKGNG